MRGFWTTFINISARRTVGLVNRNLDYVGLSEHLSQWLRETNTFIVIASMIPGTTILPIGLFLFGWTAQKHVFWLVPDIVSFIPAIIMIICCGLTITTTPGNRPRRCRSHPLLPSNPNIRHRCIPSPRRIWAGSNSFPPIIMWIWIPFIRSCDV